MRVIPQYRGVRLRPYMQKMNLFIFIFCFLLFLPFIVTYAYLNLEAYQRLDWFVIGITIAMALGDIILSIYLTWFLQEANPFFKKLERLKRLSRFLHENGYTYEKKTGQGEKKVYFPKVYLKQGKYDLTVAFEMAGGKYQDRFKRIGGALEDTFFMDFMETTDESRFKNYKLAYSAFLNRITVSDVEMVEGKGLRLMKNLYWDFESDPHLLVAGGTGGGKTVLLRSLIRALSRIGVVDICDPKRADFLTMAELPAFENRIAFDLDEIVEKFENALVIMFARYDFIRSERKRLGHKDLKKFYEYGLEPYFLICDEYNSLMSMLNVKQRDRLDKAIGPFVLLGRQAGCYFVPAMQKPSREDLGSKLQANINFRITVGRLDEMGYELAFGDVNRNKEFKYLKYVSGRRVYGRGYAAVFGEVAREFYSPLMPKNFSFYDEFEKIERIDNQFDPTENGQIDKEIIYDEQLRVFAESASFDLPISRKKKVEEDEIYYSTADIAAETDKSTSQVRKLLLLIEEKGYRTFKISDEGKRLLIDDEVEMISQLFAEKDRSTGTWEEVLQDYFNETKRE